MIAYHGTTLTRARKIAQEGFLPKKPSRAVWFACKGSKSIAERRAKQKAQQARDRAVVLTCDIDVETLRKRLGKGRVMQRGGTIAIRGSVPPTVLRSYSRSMSDLADLISLDDCSPQMLAKWANELLRLKPHKGVSIRHPGIMKLSRWMMNRLTSGTGSNRIRSTEFLQRARQCLPEFFEGVRIDPRNLQIHRMMKPVQVGTEPSPEGPDPREVEAFACLEAPSSKRRIRGLKLLARLADPDLFDWCAMFLDDESNDVVFTALHAMIRCEEGDPEVILPLADSEDKRVRGAAIAVLTRHSGEDAPYWGERGMKDPSDCVRLETARALSHLDPTEHRYIFEIARYDPNPQVARIAQKLTDGKGYGKIRLTK